MSADRNVIGRDWYHRNKERLSRERREKIDLAAAIQNYGSIPYQEFPAVLPELRDNEEEDSWLEFLCNQEVD